MKPTTAWSKWDRKKKRWIHNHVEDGHVDGDKPLGTMEQTEAWSHEKWRKTFGFLDKDGRFTVNG